MKLLPHRSNILKHFLLLSISMFLFLFYLGLSPTPTVFATNINVTTTADELDGITGNGFCSLREAIENANNDNADHTDCLSGIGDDVIALPAGTYKISADLIITDDLKIIGAGSDVTIIDRDAYQAVVTQRVFYIDSGLTVNLNGITVQNGHAEGYENGGGIYNRNAILNISDCAIASNSAGTIGLESSGYGAGIFNDGGDLKITTSTISNNIAVHRGGGIANENGGILTVNNSTFTGNKAQYGGAIVFASSITPTGNIETSTFFSNAGTIRGGGIHVQHGSLTINNSTFSGNVGNRGAGISNRDTLTITNSTITDNNTWDHNSGSVIIDEDILTDTLAIQNSIVANDVSAAPCFGEIIDGGNNLEFPGTSCGGFTVQTDPLLGPLADNGGPTLTHALQTGSPAIDAYSDALSTCPSKDQRGVPRPQPADGFCDIGAFEFTGTAQINLNYSAGPNGSLSGDTSQVVDFFDDGTPVVAVPNIGFHFVDWSDGSTDIQRIDKNVVSDVNVTATFAINQYYLNVSLDGNGNGSLTSDPPGINCLDDCSETLDYGTIVTLTATADTGSTFTGWDGDCTVSEDDCVVTIDLAKNVTATFLANPYDLNISLDGSGNGSVNSNPTGIDCPNDCTETFDYGTVVTLTATAEIGSTFSGWSGDCSGIIECVITIDLVNNVTATFTQDQYIVLVTIVGSGSVENTPGNPYTYGQTATLQPFTAENWVFAGWSGDDSAELIDNGDGTWLLLIDGDKSITATFKEIRQILLPLVLK